jgi:hypothetical protein
VAAHDEDYNEYMFDLTIHGLPLYEHATGQPLPNAQHDFSAHQVSLPPPALCPTEMGHSFSEMQLLYDNRLQNIPKMR